MSLKISNIQSLIDELKCTQCKKLLSVFPIYHCSAIGNVCGRCSPAIDWMISNGTLERAVAYEAVAKYLIFPCSNKEHGCNAEFKWDQVEEHEKSCNLSELTCPFNASMGGWEMSCAWKGAVTDLPTHLHATHTDKIQAHPLSFVMDFQQSNVQMVIVTVSDQPFIVLTKYLRNTNKFYCVALCCAKEPENQCYRFQLELGKCDDYFLILRKNTTEPYVNTAEIIDNYDKMITVDTTSVTTMLSNPNSPIYCKVGITKKNKKEIAAIMPQLKVSKESVKNSENGASMKNLSTVSQNPPTAVNNPFIAANNPPAATNNPPVAAKNLPTSPKQSVSLPKNQSSPACTKNPKTPAPAAKNPQNPKLAKVKPAANVGLTNSAPKIVKQLSKMDKQLLEELECPVCSNHMIPPIYICPTGHSICNECKDKVKECPSCRTLIMSTRNYTLEKLTTRVQYPCKFIDVGCTEIFNSEGIHNHEITCPYGSNRCPLKMLPSMCTLKTEPVDIVGHICEKHAEYIAEVNQEYGRNIKATVTSSYHVAIQENEVFIVCCKHSASSGPIKFNFVHVGMKKNEPKFRYELEFLDQTNKGMKLIVNQLCQVAPPNISAALKNCLTIPLEMLGPFIAKRAQPTLFFKFRIEKL